MTPRDPAASQGIFGNIWKAGGGWGGGWAAFPGSGSGSARCRNEGGRRKNWFGKQLLPGELPWALTQAGWGLVWEGMGEFSPSQITAGSGPKDPTNLPRPSLALPTSLQRWELGILSSADGLDNGNK